MGFTTHISVIIPCYNVQEYIAKCIDSLIAQSFKGFEAIVVDDCGKDNSIAIAEHILHTSDIDYKIIRHKENKGLSASRNTGIAAASGRYIFFLDSDDWLPCDALQVLYHKALHYEADITAANIMLVQNDTESLFGNPITAEKLIAGSDAIKSMLFNYQPCDMAQAKLYRKSLFEHNCITFPDKVFFEDIRANLHLLYFAKKVLLIEDCVYFYLKRPGSITTTFIKKYFKDRVSVMLDISNFLIEKNIIDDSYIKHLITRSILCLREVYKTQVLSSKEKFLLHCQLLHNFNNIVSCKKNLEIGSRATKIVFNSFLHKNYAIHIITDIFSRIALFKGKH